VLGLFGSHPAQVLDVVHPKKSDEKSPSMGIQKNQTIRLATEKVKLKRGIGLQIEERKEIWHPNKRAPFRP
jgi:hypothetical protein